MTILEKIEAFGHENIQCSHSSTIEITKDTFLTTKGTCILGINATKACFDLSPNVKEKIQNGNRFNIIIKVDNLIETFYGNGHKDLTLYSKKDMVFRKSDDWKPDEKLKMKFQESVEKRKKETEQ